jgi:phosphatidylinositol-3-phosphatase
VSRVATSLTALAGALAAFGALAVAACLLSASNVGVPGSSAVTHPKIDGTVFTIVFENRDDSQVLRPEVPTFFALANQYATADAYITDIHPSLPNYIMMTSGSIQGIDNSEGPSHNATDDRNNLGEQLDAAGVKWRAYMEDMGSPCRLISAGKYAVNHNPFVYYTSLSNDPARCNDRVVDFRAHFDKDLAAGEYRYMWITPNMCNNMHDCAPSAADAWLKNTAAKIMASPGYKNGGVLFILFDEGYIRVLGAEANLAAIIVSERLAKRPAKSNTRFDHRSYLATVQDIFGLPRLPTTRDATPMSELFEAR